MKNLLNILIILSLLLLIVSGCGNGAGNTTSPGTTSPAAAREMTEAAVPDTEAQTYAVFTTTSVSAEATVSAAAASPEETSGIKPETALLPENDESENENENESEDENDIVRTAESLIGIEFVQGGASPTEGFDNSGFIYYVLRENGYVSCPRMIEEQIDWGENVDYSRVKPGDVAYFSGEPGGSPEFGGICTGGGKMVYSPYPGEKVMTVDISQNYWASHFVTAISL